MVQEVSCYQLTFELAIRPPARERMDTKDTVVFYRPVAGLTWAVDSDLLCVEQAGRNDQRAGRLAK